jgi:hypothetical protein
LEAIIEEILKDRFEIRQEREETVIAPRACVIKLDEVQRNTTTRSSRRPRVYVSSIEPSGWRVPPEF